ncbi:D-alanyl-D-alanine carboxypeptidase/D-alanyl-D-alanine-endopeptidase [Shewanella sp. NIFS-20-20]|uniref:D-alanyl-D-alanine carboxypeptidase/D-alanyl-D-alanine endopeptidase n=1 Tax=Shewanella sp. NIFS-20-20 TaxID=2853806 RepID=UPI001C4431BB|nr:D-alanyl-D-alanine carboxypeptidase/D-alanyl-D-alanine-endopeptidase [Shewanella sp. NIFS-20-20]MBV7315249.1 D-alanyl-D-alanine carboxypeptidase/D-alanyl-D-alanine-endopeptidase [Shewanella sp. NIFS-20-20]
MKSWRLGVGLSLWLGVCQANDSAKLAELVEASSSPSSISSVWLQTPSETHEFYSQRLMTPASLQKLLVASAALLELGADFRFITELSITGKIIDGQLHGNVILNYSGDPTLSQADLSQLLQALLTLGISRIEGDILLAHQGTHLPKYQDEHGIGWIWDELGICYAAPMSVYTINHNCQRASLKQNNASSQIVAQGPELMQLTSSARFTDDPHCQLRLEPVAANHAEITGCIDRTAPLPLAIAIDTPALANQSYISHWLSQHQIALKGAILTNINSFDSSESVPLKKHQSPPLSSLLEEVLLKSDNLIADALFKRLGQQHFHEWSFTAGARAMVSILQQQGVTLPGATIIDGSGLSRYNQLSAQHLGQVLTLIAKQPRLHLIKQRLPVAGVSGTLRHKPGFNAGSLHSQVKAKTGSMSGVNNVAGYMATPNGEYSFVILENGLVSRDAIGIAHLAEANTLPLAPRLLTTLQEHAALH